jgi:hypothetical protein
MSEPADVPYQPDDLERLEEYTRKRGYRRFTALALFLAGCVPALLAVLVTQGRSGSLPLVAALLVVVPTGVLFFWTYRDRDGQEARELGMWVRTLRRSRESGDVRRVLRELPEVPNENEIDRIDLDDTATEYRDALTPLVSNPGVLRLRIAIYRNWYVVGSLLITLLAAVTLLVVSPPS